MFDAFTDPFALLTGGRRSARRSRPRASRKPRIESLETRQLLAVSGMELLDPASVNGTTGEKPQSKVWEHGQHWWASWGDSSGTFVRRLDDTTWTRDLKISSDTFSRADALSQGDVTHILLKRSNTLELASIELVPGNPPRYQPWSARPSSVDIRVDPETATIAVDSTDRMWLAYDNGSQIEVLYSDAPYAVWSGPVVLATGVNDDDIAAITALPGGSIGVMWSNQSTQRFGFRVHADGASPANWSANEVPASQSALPVGNGMADDHLNMAVASDGTLYAAVKTEYNTAGYTQIGLLVRKPDGTWDPMYEVDTEGTRPIVQLNEANHSLLVMYRIDAARPIVYRECSTISFVCGQQTVLLDTPASLNNVSGSKQNHTDDLVVLAAGDGVLASVRLLTGDAVNQAPFVDAGADRSVVVGASLSLAGGAADDGRPDPPAALTTTWSAVSGPAAVVFANPAERNTTATFTAAGVYVLRLTAYDGELSGFDDVVVTVSDGRQPVIMAFQDGIFPHDAYAGTRDTYIHSQSPTANYGNAVELATDGAPDVAALLRWDVSAIPAGSTVTGVQLTLDVTGKSPELYELYRIRRPWTESEATWQQAAAGWNWETPGILGAGDRDTSVLGQVSLGGTGQATFDLNTSGIAAVQAWIDSPGTNYGLVLQDYDLNSNGLEFSSREAANAGNRPRLTITYAAADQQGNQTPSVNAGVDQSALVNTPLALDATVTDDGLPNPPGAVATEWRLISGPGSVAFADAAAIDTTATFSQAGSYVLRLTADDGQLASSDDLVVTVTDGREPVTISFQDGATYAGTTDAMISAGAATANYGAATTLSFDGAPQLATLLRWDIAAIAPGATVESAAITLNVTNRTDDVYELYEVLRPWVEGQVTWQQAAAGAPWQSPGAQGSSDRGTAVLGTITAPIVQSVTISLTPAGIAAVQRWIDNPAANYGVVIQDYLNADNGADISARETASASLRPRLSITYRAAASGELTQMTALSPAQSSQTQDGGLLAAPLSPQPTAPQSTLIETTDLAVDAVATDPYRARREQWTAGSLPDRVAVAAPRVAPVSSLVGGGDRQGNAEGTAVRDALFASLADRPLRRLLRQR